MPSKFQIKLDTSAVQRYFHDQSKILFFGTKEAFRKTIVWTHREFVANATTKLNVRTGNLRRSFMFSMDGNSLSSLRSSAYQETLKGKVKLGSEVIYARIHELGGTVKAKDKYTKVPGGPYLNIPLGANKTAAGVMRRTAKQVFDASGYLARSRKGSWLVFNRRGLPMFVLKKQVKIPARLGLRDVMARSSNELAKHLKQVLEAI